MMGFSYEPGVTSQEVEAALRCLSLSDAEDVPVLAIEPGLEAGEGRVLFASRSLLAIFGVGDLAQLAARIYGTTDPGFRRLRDVAVSLAEDGSPRLERLRFFLGPAGQTFTFLCRKIARMSGAVQRRPIFVAAALGVKTPSLPAAPAAAAPVERAELEAPTATRPPEAVMPPLVVPAGTMTLAAVKAALAPRFSAARTIRFLWRTDANDKITEITPPLAEVVGSAAADLLGRDFGDVAKHLALDPDGRLARVFAKRETWSGLDVLWPVAGAAAAVPVSLGGLPAFDRTGGFDGYRGFGVIHIERLVAAAPHAFEVAPPPQPLAEPQAPVLAPAPANVVILRPFAQVAKIATAPAVDEPRLRATDMAEEPLLSSDERTTFEQIAEALANGERAAPESPRAPAAELHEALLLSEPISAPANEAAIAPLAAAEPPHIEAAADPASPAATAASSRAAWLAQNGFGPNAMAILDRLGQGLLVSRDDVPIYVNRYLLDLLGYEDEDAFHAAGAMARTFEQPPTAGGGTLNLRTAAGETVAVQARMQTVEWDELPATLLTLRRDEESEPRATFEAALRARENDIRERDAILDTATDGLAIIDAEGRILALNRSAQALFGYDQGDVAGQPFSILLAPESESRAKDYFEGLRKNGVASLLNDGREFVGRPRQGGAIPIFVTLGRVSHGRDGEPEQKFCALFRDLTHWKKVEQDLQDARSEAERASALKSDFLAKVSHEIRTPLNAILGFAEVILEERFGPIGNARYHDYLKDIHASGAHLMSLVNDLLDLSKIEAGKMELAIASVDANRIISECVSIMQLQANRERVIMRLALAPQLPKVMADERSLRQIVLNLLSNAVKFNEPGGQVIVASAITDAGNAVIRIRDTGIGMSEQDIETALEPFRQLATSRPTTGTGLGLPLTKALIEANRASLTIKSKKNEGTLVEVVFPPARVVAA